MPINYFIGAPNRNRTSDTQFRNFIPIKFYIDCLLSKHYYSNIYKYIELLIMINL